MYVKYGSIEINGKKKIIYKKSTSSKHFIKYNGKYITLSKYKQLVPKKTKGGGDVKVSEIVSRLMLLLNAKKELDECRSSKCNNEIQKIKQKTSKLDEDSKKNFKDFMSKKISQKKYLQKKKEIFEKVNQFKEKKFLIDCEVNKCQNQLQEIREMTIDGLVSNGFFDKIKDNKKRDLVLKQVQDLKKKYQKKVSRSNYSKLDEIIFKHNNT